MEHVAWYAPLPQHTHNLYDLTGREGPHISIGTGRVFRPHQMAQAPASSNARRLTFDVHRTRCSFLCYQRYTPDRHAWDPLRYRRLHLLFSYHSFRKRMVHPTEGLSIRNHVGRNGCVRRRAAPSDAMATALIRLPNHAADLEPRAVHPYFPAAALPEAAVADREHAQTQKDV